MTRTGSGFESISVDVSNGLATITLDRPDRLNAYTVDMGDQIVQAMDELDNDDDVRAIIFTGRGRCFCVGADLSSGTDIFERRRGGEFRMDRDADSAGLVVRRLLQSAKPLIAAITGLSRRSSASGMRCMPRK